MSSGNQLIRGWLAGYLLYKKGRRGLRTCHLSNSFFRFGYEHVHGFNGNDFGLPFHKVHLFEEWCERVKEGRKEELKFNPQNYPACRETSDFLFSKFLKKNNLEILNLLLFYKLEIRKYHEISLSKNKCVYFLNTIDK
jgi:hypothetical protein